MQDLISRLKAIEFKVSDLLEENKKLQQIISDKDAQINALISENLESKQELAAKLEELVALKTANAMLGSDEHKTKTKLKINALVKDIDQCIAQLA